MSLSYTRGFAIGIVGLAFLTLAFENPLAHPLGFTNDVNRASCEDGGFCCKRPHREIGFDSWLSSRLEAWSGMVLGDKGLVSQMLVIDPAGFEVNNRIDGIISGAGMDTTHNHAGERSQLVGYTMLGSGLLLCSWGIISWQIKEYQDCPPRNTDNVIKIVAGILLINAGLFYLFGGCD